MPRITHNLKAPPISSTIYFLMLCMAIALSLAIRISALDPQSLFLDDAWAALITKVTDLRDFVLVNSASPPLFGFILWLISRVYHEKELSMQLLPLLCSLLQGAMMFQLIKLHTRNHFFSLLGAAALLYNPLILTYSTRVKQYTLESLVTVSLLYVASYILIHKKLLSFKLFTLIVISLFASLTSFLISWYILSILALTSLHKTYKQGLGLSVRKLLTNKSVLHFITFTCILILYYLVLLRPKANSALVEYWDKFYISLDQSFTGFIGELMGKFNVLISNAFPVKWFTLINGFQSFFPYLFLFIILGLIAVASIKLCKKGYPELGLLPVFFYSMLVITSVLRFYPMAGMRTDIFTYPITIFYSIYGLAEVWKYVFDKLPILKMTPVAAAYVLATLVVFYSLPPKIYYSDQNKASIYIDEIQQNITNRDRILIFPHGVYSYAYYSDAAFRFVPDHVVGTGFTCVFSDPQIVTMPFIKGYEENGSEYDHLLEGLYQSMDKDSKLYYFATSHTYPAGLYIPSYLEKLGFNRISINNDLDSALITYIK